MGNPSGIYTDMENKYIGLVICMVIDCGLIGHRCICGVSWWNP